MENCIIIIRKKKKNNNNNKCVLKNALQSFSRRFNWLSSGFKVKGTALLPFHCVHLIVPTPSSRVYTECFNANMSYVVGDLFPLWTTWSWRRGICEWTAHFRWPAMRLMLNEVEQSIRSLILYIYCDSSSDMCGVCAFRKRRSMKSPSTTMHHVLRL